MTDDSFYMRGYMVIKFALKKINYLIIKYLYLLLFILLVIFIIILLLN